MLERDISRPMAIYSLGRHPRRHTDAYDCLTLHRYVGGRRHVATMSILPSQSARNRILAAEIRLGIHERFCLSHHQLL